MLRGEQKTDHEWLGIHTNCHWSTNLIDKSTLASEWKERKRKIRLIVSAPLILILTVTTGILLLSIISRPRNGAIPVESARNKEQVEKILPKPSISKTVQPRSETKLLMDPTIIAAVIGAFATVIAAVIGLQSGKKKGLKEGRQAGLEQARQEYRHMQIKSPCFIAVAGSHDEHSRASVIRFSGVYAIVHTIELCYELGIKTLSQ
jgi:hypothetical protein